MTKVKWYGSLNNRLAEAGKDAEEIKVGMGATEFHWSDRSAYEVIEVIDQKHIVIREYDHIHKGDAYENSWELVSNPEKPAIKLTKRGNYWYRTCTVTASDLKDDIDFRLWLCHWGFDMETIKAKGKQTKYSRMNIRIGYADYYFDYEF